MFRRAVLCCLGIALAGNSLSAQNSRGKPVDKAANVPDQFDVVFGNSSRVRMALQVQNVEIETIYGKLTVPVKDIRSIEFGVRFPKGTAEKIGQAVKKLGSKDEGERLSAGQALVDLGPYSYEAVLQASTMAKVEPDMSRRAKDVLKKLEQKFAKKELTRSSSDVVVVPKMKIIGQIQAASWNVNVEYFGAKKIDVATVRNLRNVSGKEERTPAELLQGTWHVTQLTVEGRVEVKEMSMVIAKDQIILRSADIGHNETGTFKLGTSEQFQTIDLITQHEQMYGIYELDGDVLKMCLRSGRNGNGAGRPTSFESLPGSDQAVLLLKRKTTD